jgi:CheY-like chemotaxis protein
MIIDERSGSTVAVVRKVGGLISAAWPKSAYTDDPPAPVPPAARWRAPAWCGDVATDMRRILIVDHDAESAELLAMLLQAMGCGETQVRRLGSAAVALAVEFRATIVFIDLKLPDMSGYEVARLLHQHPLLQKPRLIALTDSGEQPAREFARAAGFERYLVKPVTRAAVEEALATS